MRGGAFTDYKIRIREVVALVRLSLDQGDAELGSTIAKGAVVMTAAALERFINDAVRAVCRSIGTPRWDKLTVGHRRYLHRQFALRMQSVGSAVLIPGSAVEKNEAKLRELLETCTAAMQNPSTWQHEVDFGMFMGGQAAPDKIENILGQFDGTGRGIYGLLADRGWDKQAILRSLAQLVDARHGVAHALEGAPSVSPGDARVWLVCSYWLAVHIDDFLSFAHSGKFPHTRAEAGEGTRPR